MILCSKIYCIRADVCCIFRDTTKSKMACSAMFLGTSVPADQPLSRLAR